MTFGIGCPLPSDAEGTPISRTRMANHDEDDEPIEIVGGYTPIIDIIGGYTPVIVIVGGYSSDD